MMKVSFAHNEPEASPFLLAMEAFCLERAGQLHRDVPGFSLNAIDAYFDADRVVVPVSGQVALEEIQNLASVPITLHVHIPATEKSVR